MKKMMALVLAFVVAAPIMAETEKVDGYTWTYTVSNGKAEISNNGSAAISPNPTGAVRIPSTLGGVPVTSIGSSAFSGCSGLTSVTIPNSVTIIGYDAFNDCSGLTSVTIPDSVTRIGRWAFYGCSGLTSVTIPDSVTNIEDYAFYKCSGLTSVTIGNGVTSIGDRAFCNCSGLTSVYITDIAKWCGISFGDSDANPLSYAHNLYLNDTLITNLMIPNEVTSIGNYAFYNCSGLTSVTIPDGVTSIGNYAFYNCSGLTSVMIPNSVTNIGGSAFKDCSWLTSVMIPDGVTSIGDWAFSGCSGLTSVTIPDSVTSIGASAFSSCSGLTSVTIGNGVTRIGSSAFHDCSGLTSVTIPNSVGYISQGVFYNCSGLTSVTIPAGVTSIGPGAFERCVALTSVTIPDSVRSIWYRAFYDCIGLTSVTIGNSVMDIGDSAFYNCSSLTSLTIPDSVTSIASFAFYNCSSLTSLMIGNGLMYIGNSAFAYCIGLRSIKIPASVRTIGDSAFLNMLSLESVDFLPSPPQVGNSVFSGCPQSAVGYYLPKYTDYWNAVIGSDGRWQGLYMCPCAVTATLTFNPNGGTVSPTKMTVPTDVIGTMPVPTRSGYVFDGWYTAVNGGEKYSETTIVTQDVTLFAHWRANVANFTVTFNPNGGSVSPVSRSVANGAAVGTLPTPTRTGYTFNGWWTSASGGTQVSASTKVTANVTYYAHWTANVVNFTVTFNPNGGSVSPASRSVANGAAVGTLPTSTRAGYAFDGWWTSASGGTQVSASTKVTANVTYYAHWTLLRCKVTFGKNGGTGGDSYVTATYGQPMPTPRTAPTRGGYIFEGYWTTTGSGGVCYYDGNMKSLRNWDKVSDTTLWAKWRQAAVVKVTFGKNGGSGGDAYVTCTEGQPMPTPRTAPTQSGWTFAGYWDTLAVDEKGNPKGKQYYDASMKSVRNFDKTTATTLWAKWTNKVTFGKNGGTGGDNYVTCTKGQPMPKRTMPSRSGYAFMGYWTTTGAGGVKYYDMDGTSAHVWDKSGNVTLWAKWVVPVNCKVTFGKNGGSGGDNYVTATTGKPMPTPRTAPTRAGWTFDGYWDTLAQDANGNPTGKQYYDKDMKSVRNWDGTSAATLWAKWTVRVKLGKNGGSGGDDYVTVTYNQPFPKCTMPKRSGYAFGGYWVSASSKTGQCYNADGTGTSSMKWTTGGTPTVWALWTSGKSAKKASAPVDMGVSEAWEGDCPQPPPDAVTPWPAGQYTGVVSGGAGWFMLQLDGTAPDGSRTAFLVMETADGGVSVECEAEVAGDVLLLVDDDGTSYRFEWDGCLGEAALPTMRLFKVELALP